MRKIAKFAVLTTAALGMLAAPTLAETLRLGTEGAYPPFNYIESDGKIAGFDVEIGLELCKRIGAECNVVAQDWDGIIPGLLANKYDFIIASMFITKDRKKQVDFTDPYYLAAMTHVVPKGSDITEFTNDALAGKVISGRIDLQVGDMLPMLDWTTKTEDGSGFELAGAPITDPAFVGEGVGIALRQEDDALRERLNAALKEIRADGTYKTINDKYFTVDVYTMK